MNKDKTEDNYHYGMDFLKVVATVMIIALHILGQGGLLESVSLGSPNYYVVWVIECFCFVGVNLYALETGFLNAQKEVKRRALVKRWLQVFFYTTFFTALFAILMPGVVSLKSWIKALMPVIFNQYWYFTQYFAVFLVMPYVNRMMKSLSKESFKRLVLTIVFLLSFLPTFRQYDIFVTAGGFSTIWLLGLYIIGGYFSYYKDDFKFSKKIYILCIFLSNFVTLAVKFLVDYATGETMSMVLIDYTSLPMLISSLAIFALALCMKIKRGKRIVKFVGRLTFGVYLFHVNAFIWQYIFFGLFAFMTTWNPINLTLGVAVFNFIIFTLGGAFEFLRIKFFDLAKIDKLGDWVGAKIGLLLNGISKYVP